uniref:hypothetical protein n=1 Tax=Salmonella sp. s58079 TaxID=3159700 RepID=UPI003981389C
MNQKIPPYTGLPSLDSIPSVADLTASLAKKKEEKRLQEEKKKEEERRAKETRSLTCGSKQQQQHLLPARILGDLQLMPRKPRALL